LHGGTCQAAFEPGWHFLQTVELDEFARFIKADQVAHLAKHRNVGDGVFIVHDPLPSGQTRFHHAKQAFDSAT
jgi:hypothetical protein